MRKKIGKRIGPVPIALVAVLALAAFISAGLWLAPSGGQTAEAQGFADGDSAELETAGTKCTITVHDGDATFEGRVSGGGCIVSGESVDVIFENGEGIAAGNTLTTDERQRIAVYTTGGSDFSTVQATDHVVVDDGEDNPLDSIVNLGKRGVDEDFLTIDEASSGPGDIPVPGSVTLTVTQSMSKDGKVYMFGYFAGDDWAFVDAAIGVPLSVFVDDDERGTERETVALALAGTAASTTQTAIGTARTVASRLTQTVDDAVVATFTDDPTALLDVAQPGTDDGTNDEQARVNSARARIITIKGHPKYGSASTLLRDQVVAAELAIMQAQAAIDAIEDGDPRHFMNQEADFVVVVEFRDDAVAAKLVGGQYMPDDPKGTAGSFMITGTTTRTDESKKISHAAKTADVYVEIRDENGVPLAGFVELTIDTSATGAENATFEGSNRTVQRVKLGEEVEGEGDEEVKVLGTAVAKVQGLPQNDPLRVPITTNFNDGELVLEGYITRQGDADMITTTAYVCVRDGTDQKVEPPTIPTSYVNVAMVESEEACNTEIGALKTPGASDDPDEVVSLGPDAIFFISAKAVDSVGNTIAEDSDLSWSVTEGADNEADAKTAIAGSDTGETDMVIMIAGKDDAKAGTYSITVEDANGAASGIVMITVSDVASIITLTCDPEMVPIRTGETLCTATVTDANGSIPSNLVLMGDGRHKVTITVRNKDARYPPTENFNAMGMAMFAVLLGEDVEVGRGITVNVTTIIGGETLRQSTVVTYGEVAVPGMPMNVMAEATSDTMITVTWDAADDGGSDITGYVLQSKTGTMDFMTIAASSAEVWWNTLGLPDDER